MAIQWDGTITLGSVLTIVTLVGIAVSLGVKLGSFEGTLKHHATTMAEHAARLTAQESRMVDLVASVQRLIGRMEVSNERADAAAREATGRYS